MSGSDYVSSSGPLDSIERRRHSRSYVAGVALLSHPKHGDNDACLIRNLSRTGALLLSCPPLPVGEPCGMVLTAPGLMGEELRGRVTRAGMSSDGSPWAAVEFLDVSDEQSARLDRVISLEIQSSDAPSVLVVDGSSLTLQNTALLLAKFSRKALLASTSLAVANWLEERSRHIALALVGKNILGITPDALLSYLGSTYPHIHRATLSKIPNEQSLQLLLDRTEAESSEHYAWNDWET